MLVGAFFGVAAMDADQNAIVECETRGEFELAKDPTQAMSAGARVFWDNINRRLAPSFELVFHFNRAARRPNKIVPCVWAGHVNPEKGGLRAKDGTVGEWQHAGQGVQEFRIPDNVLRITRHKGRGIEVEHPAVLPIALQEFLMRAYGDAGDLVYEPFGGAGTTILAGERTGCRVAAMELAPGYVDLAIARWQALHSEQPVTLDDGRSYAEVAAERQEEHADAG